MLKNTSELLNEADAGGLSGVEPRDEAAEINASREPKGSSHVLGELLRGEGSIGIEGHLGPRLAHLGETNLVAECMNVLAENHVIHAIALERLETSDLGDEVHDPVITSHELTEPKAGVAREVLLAEGVSEDGCLTLHRCTDNVNPRGESHVERSRRVDLVRVRDQGGQVKLLDEADCGLEVLVPWDIGKTIVKVADDGLEKDEAESGLEDLLMVLVAVERLAESRDGGIAMPHDVLVNLLGGDVGCSLEVLGGNAEAAVEIGPVGLKSREDEVGSNRTVLVGVEDREN